MALMLVVLVFGFVGLCALFAWLMNDWMTRREDVPSDSAVLDRAEDSADGAGPSGL
jgi:hypothetical protein